MGNQALQLADEIQEPAVVLVIQIRQVLTHFTALPCQLAAQLPATVEIIDTLKRHHVGTLIGIGIFLTGTVKIIQIGVLAQNVQPVLIHRTISQPNIKLGKASVILAGIVIVAVGKIQLANTGPFFVNQKTQIIYSRLQIYTGTRQTPCNYWNS